MGAIFLGQIYLDIGDTDEAQKWFYRAAKLAPPEFPLADAMKEPLLLRRGDIEGSLEYARKNIAFDPRGRYTLANLRNHDLQTGNFDEALARYETAFPALFAKPHPVVDRDNLDVAVDVALVLLRMGRLERGNRLLDRSLEVIAAATSSENPSGYSIEAVMIYTLKGDAEAALDTLRQTIDDGWRDDWWLYLEIDPSLDSIRDEPRFQSMLQEIRDDMASQRERLEEMEVAGLLESVPESE
jgi:tetratricopeptide (TPR) repeat protein